MLSMLKGIILSSGNSWNVSACIPIILNFSPHTAVLLKMSSRFIRANRNLHLCVDLNIVEFTKKHGGFHTDNYVSLAPARNFDRVVDG